jgi:hypothetical protein
VGLALEKYEDNYTRVLMYGTPIVWKCVGDLPGSEMRSSKFNHKLTDPVDRHTYDPR